MKKISFVDLQSQYQKYQKEIQKNINITLEKCQFVGGDFLNEFEKKLSQYTGTRHAIGCSSGSDALLLALKALDIGVGDEVITTPFTYYATVEMIVLLGAKPVLVDIEKDSYLINVQQIEQAITEKTKAIVSVSLFGQTANMTAINRIAKKYKIPVIEDAAQSFGAKHRDKKSGNLSTLACTSFFPAKALGGYGDGGAVFTNNNQLAIKIRKLLNHGQNKLYNHQYIGINGRLDNMQAGVLLVKLKYLDKELSKRKQIASFYDKNLNADKITPQKIERDNDSIYSVYSFTTTKRDILKKKLEAKKIPSMIYYQKPLHLQPALAFLNYKRGQFPVTEKTSKEILSIPVHPYLEKEQRDYIVESINSLVT